MTTTAQSIQITTSFGIDNLAVVPTTVPSIGHGQVLVEMKAVSLNFRDFLVVLGKYNPNLPKPMTICSDGAGEVKAVGDGVTRFKSGDRVMSSFFQDWTAGDITRETGKSALGGAIDGVLTTARLFDEAGLVGMPAHLSYEEGATLPCAAVTAWHGMVTSAHVNSGNTVLLLGTGGVSIFGLQFAKLHGARAIITSSSDEKLARAKSLGADEVINYKKTPDWEKTVLGLTGGRGVDVVLEVGGAGTLARSIKSTIPGGQVSLIGVLAGLVENLNVAPILHDSIRVQGIYVGSIAMFEAMNRAIIANHLKPVIDRTFSFDQAKDAIRHMESAQHFGKIVITL